MRCKFSFSYLLGQNILKETRIKFLELASQSPDLSPVEISSGFGGWNNYGGISSDVERNTHERLLCEDCDHPALVIHRMRTGPLFLEVTS